MSNPNVSPLFKVIPEDDPASQPAPVSPQENAVAIQMIRLALSAIWQRFAAAVADLFILFAGASVFALYMQAPPDPSVRQLVLFGMYSAFVLLASGLVYWRRGK